ncbi:MAG TPA: KH domain-containing protein [Candidatus Onthousia excrementipullorum]|uniref:KH domain-containing protein n=1 Tax=Candidatus Onthousia excrementipullorum TaxID=2840884 RepID=A0A9D1DVD3_9FIRM|nr:KH domain-containing protein [Candidatus Onthousia excrementipullorum]
MVNKHEYTGKTYEEAVNKAKIDLQELEENLIINTKEEKKTLLSKKVEIEVIEKREVKDYLKKLIKTLLKDMGFDVEIEITVNNNTPTYRLYSTNDALLIGKDGKNLKALTTVVNAILTKEINSNYRFLIDVSDYKEKNDRRVERLAKKLAREVRETKVEVKMDSMNSYQRRLVHNILNNNKYVYTESVGEEPNRCVVIKPRD